MVILLKNFILVLLSSIFSLVFFVPFFVNAQYVEVKNTVEEQYYNLDTKGEFFQVDENDYKVHTYETVCKGFIEQKIYDDRIEYVKYDQTGVIDIDTVPVVSTTTIKSTIIDY